MTTTQYTVMPPLVAERYEQYLKDNHGEIDVQRLCSVMWSAGARHAVAATASWSGMAPQLRQFENRFAVLAELVELIQEVGK